MRAQSCNGSVVLCGHGFCISISISYVENNECFDVWQKHNYYCYLNF